MRPWEILGNVFVYLGIVVVFVGILKVIEPYSAPQGMNTLEAFVPYLVPSLLCFAVGGVSIAVNSSKKVNKKTELDSKPDRNTSIAASEHEDSRIVCGKCRAMNDSDSVFCKKCGNSLRTYSTP